MRARLGEGHVSLVRLARRLADPRLAIAAHQQALDDRTTRLVARVTACIAGRRDAIARAQRRLAYLHPQAVVARERAEVARLGVRLETLYRASFERRAGELRQSTARLDALSPLKVLARGYAIATRDDGRAVRSARDVTTGEAIHVRVRDAHIHACVDRVEALGPQK
jgi:exodeoxyribonuclease VII large subunit